MTASVFAGLRGALMVQGTTSDAGKSTVVAGLCRAMRRRGVRVAPFKPQNMALNSAVTVDGGEIGRAQALQAQAAGLEPHTDMNPVLLKPASDTGAQVIVNGRVHGDLDARGYHALKPALLETVLAAYRRLRASCDVVLVEGAGSPAEVNLREGDIANMGFAMPARCPVVIVADIDRGGVFAHLAGTLDCLAPAEVDAVRGFIVNRFRGDAGLLAPGLEWLHARCGKPVMGVLPYLQGLQLDAEDAITPRQRAADDESRLRVAVPVYPRISNHTDLDALGAHPQVDLRFVGPGRPIPPCDLIVLAGSKSVRADLDAMRAHGWDRQIERHLRYGGRVIGICGGLQMLGMALHDPAGVEGPPGSSPGLGWLELETTLGPTKHLERVAGTLLIGSEPPVRGYEIHMGVSRGPALERPAAVVAGREDGAISRDGHVLGTYVHGLFDEPEACAALLAWAGLAAPRRFDIAALREASLERLADAIESHLDLAALAAACRQASA